MIVSIQVEVSGGDHLHPVEVADLLGIPADGEVFLLEPEGTHLGQQVEANFVSARLVSH